MASLNELINLSQYQSGDVGRSNLPVIRRATFQEKQSNALKLQDLALQIERRKAEAAIAKKQQELWENIGNTQNNDKTTSGITTNVVDKEEAGGRDITPVGDYSKEWSYGYEPKINSHGKIVLTNPAKYDRVKVIDRAKKMVDSDLATEGVDRKTIKASDYSSRLKSAIPEAENYLKMSGLSPSKADEAIKTQPVNPTGLTSSPEDFLPEYKEKRGMIDVAKDFYFGNKKSNTQENEKVMIVTPDGKKGYIPKINLDKAIKRGAKLVQ